MKTIRFTAYPDGYRCDQPGDQSGEYVSTQGFDYRRMRDYFAAAAISPMLVQAYGSTPEILARKAYEIADAMLAAREKGQS